MGRKFYTVRNLPERKPNYERGLVCRCGASKFQLQKLACQKKINTPEELDKAFKNSLTSYGVPILYNEKEDDFFHLDSNTVRPDFSPPFFQLLDFIKVLQLTPEQAETWRIKIASTGQRGHVLMIDTDLWFDYGFFGKVANAESIEQFYYLMRHRVINLNNIRDRFWWVVKDFIDYFPIFEAFETIEDWNLADD